MNKAKRKLSKIYFKLGLYEDSLKLYKILKDHQMINKCYDRLFLLDEQNADIWVSKGDYLIELDLIP